MNYILDDKGNPVLVANPTQWALWYEKAERHVGLFEENGVKVSTVFLGLDHQWGDGPPILWETMVFGGPLDQEQDRCSGSRDQAEAMHSAMVKRVKEAK